MSEDRFRWFNHFPAGIRIRRMWRTIWAELTFPQGYAPGHFYSPIPAREEMERGRERIFHSEVDELPDIDLGGKEQLELLKRLANQRQRLELPETSDGRRRYFTRNDYFAIADGLMLATMLMEHRPARYLEIGSGFSSALALDIGEQFLEGRLQYTFIEPYPVRLRSLLRPTDNAKVTIRESKVQAVPDAVFKELVANDVLFVDSSHVSKAGSDLNDILFRILPLLRPGVLIHFHDIFWPFEYRESDIFGGRSWNEAYLLHALLANNRNYRMTLFGSWLELRRPTEWQTAFGKTSQPIASSLWIQKIA